MDIQFIDLKAQYEALRESIDGGIRKVLEHGRYIMGPEVRELEERLSQFTGAGYCITCASGTEALLIALMALGVGPGDEVVTTPFSFISTAEAIVLLGARPVFADIEPDTCNIDAAKIEAAITSRTRAIMPVSLYGQPADMDKINAIAAEHYLPVIEDGAQSFGAEYKGRKSCNLSTIGCTSFFPSKPLGCYGDGGAIFTNDHVLAKGMREIRVHGQESRYHHSRIGVGGRMDTLQCAIVLAKLERFEWEIQQRQRVAQRYSESLNNLFPEIEPLTVKPDRTSVYAQYTVLSTNREGMQKTLAAQGIPTAVHYPLPIHRQPAYSRFHNEAVLTFSETVAQQVISLPMYPDMTPSIQDTVIEAIKRIT